MKALNEKEFYFEQYSGHYRELRNMETLSWEAYDLSSDELIFSFLCLKGMYNLYSLPPHLLFLESLLIEKL